MFDPWQLYQQRIITGLNMLVLGMIGRGKSALVKSLLLRSVLHGIRGVVFDVKGEYAPLAEALGCTPLRLAPGGTVRLNPLDPRSSPREQAELVEALAATALGPIAAAGGTHRPRTRPRPKPEPAAREATLPRVVDALLSTPPRRWRPRSTPPRRRWPPSCREVALELRRLCDGALAGMFDGPTTAGVDFAAPLVVVDLSRGVPLPRPPGRHDLCGRLAPDRPRRRRRTRRRMVVMDESWRMFSHLAIAAWMQQSFKLSRASGTMNVLVMHRLSDLASAGAAGSHQVRLAEGLLADTETRVIYGQPASEVEHARELLGLSDTEAKLLPHLPRGQALWKVGTRSLPRRPSSRPDGAGLVDTDARMTTSNRHSADALAN